MLTDSAKFRRQVAILKDKKEKLEEIESFDFIKRGVEKGLLKLNYFPLEHNPFNTKCHGIYEAYSMECPKLIFAVDDWIPDEPGLTIKRLFPMENNYSIPVQLVLEKYSHLEITKLMLFHLDEFDD